MFRLLAVSAIVALGIGGCSLIVDFDRARLADGGADAGSDAGADSGVTDGGRDAAADAAGSD